MSEVKIVYYHGHAIKLAAPRKGICDACGKSVGNGIQKTNIHHWKYAYGWKKVRENPSLALDNTSELCYSCHQIADALRNLTHGKNITAILDVLKLAPKETRICLDELGR